MQAEAQFEMIQRLQSARGHLDAVIGMLERDERCVCILQQLAAVKSALHAAGIGLLVCQLKQSQDVLRYSTSAQERVDEIAHLIFIFHFLAKYSNDNERSQYERKFSSSIPAHLRDDVRIMRLPCGGGA